VLVAKKEQYFLLKNPPKTRKTRFISLYFTLFHFILGFSILIILFTPLFDPA